MKQINLCIAGVLNAILIFRRHCEYRELQRGSQDTITCLANTRKMHLAELSIQIAKR